MASPFLTVVICAIAAVAVLLRRSVRLPESMFWVISERCSRSETATVVLIWAKRAATLVVMAVAVGLLWVVARLDLWAPTIAWLGAFVGWLSITSALLDEVGEAIDIGELAPLFAAIEEVRWRARWKESEFRDALLEHLHARFQLTQRHESPVETGTQVDLRVLYRGVDWFITIKKGISNQKRLILQGEAEDILAHVQDRRRKFGILVVLGLSPRNPGKQETHASSLERHLAERGIAAERNGRGVRSYVLRLTIQR